MCCLMVGQHDHVVHVSLSSGNHLRYAFLSVHLVTRSSSRMGLGRVRNSTNHNARKMPRSWNLSGGSTFGNISTNWTSTLLTLPLSKLSNEVSFYHNMFIPIMLNQIMRNPVRSYVVTNKPHMIFIFNSKIIQYNLHLLNNIPHVVSRNLACTID
jgi:hypothetical protein